MKKIIKLPVYGIEVNLGNGCLSIKSDLHDGSVNPENRETYWGCAVDAIEGLILAHACAGVDIESAAYLEGIEVVIDTLTNNNTEEHCEEEIAQPIREITDIAVESELVEALRATLFYTPLGSLAYERATKALDKALGFQETTN